MEQTAQFEDPIGTLIDLDRYPIDDLSTTAAQQLIANCQRDMTTSGACSLPGFVRPASVAASVAVGERLADKTWHANQTHNIYFTDPDPALSPDHPRNRQVRSSQHAIAYDLLPEDVPIRRIYESEAVLAFVAAVLGFDQLYRSVDPLDALDISLYGDGDELGWHFDNSEFSVTLMLREPISGGHFEYHPALRTDDDQRYDSVEAALDGRGPAPLRLATAPGTLALFRGRHALHRVSPVEGEVARMNAVLTYGSTPGMHLSELTQVLFYGRRVLPTAG